MGTSPDNCSSSRGRLSYDQRGGIVSRSGPVGLRQVSAQSRAGDSSGD
jgi:hypothetical protein